METKHAKSRDCLKPLKKLLGEQPQEELSGTHTHLLNKWTPYLKNTVLQYVDSDGIVRWE